MAHWERYQRETAHRSDRLTRRRRGHKGAVGHADDELGAAERAEAQERELDRFYALVAHCRLPTMVMREWTRH